MKHSQKHNPLFTGRERILEELDIYFTSLLPDPLRIAALSGMPGVGKTEIALEYVYRSYRKYQAVIWLNASSRYELVEDIAKMLHTFGMSLSCADEDERERTFASFREWLWGYQSSFLLVLDDIADDSLINQVLDDGMVGHVIVTKASLRNIEYFQEIRVKPFNDEDGPLFLLHCASLLTLGKSLKQASSKLQRDAYAIHKEFGGHPLALDQAGVYVSETGVSLAEYLALYQQDKRTFLDRRGTDSPYHPFSAYGVIAAMRQGAAYNAQELLVLYVKDLINCSDTYPQLPSTLHVSSLLRQQASDPSTLFEMRATLIQNFLLVPLAGGNKWGMHPLVRAVMLEIMAYEREQDRISRAKDDEYEPLTEDDIFWMLVEVQQMKQRQAFPLDDRERLNLVRGITTPVIRLKRAVLPAARRQREQAKKRIEDRYSALAYQRNAPLGIASQDDIRRYAQELLALMQYR